MAYIWFNKVLEALGKRINFESISNLYGNSFAKDAGKLVQSSNPLLKLGGNPKGSGVMSLMGKIKVVEAKDTEVKKAVLKQEMGDLSWAEGLF